MRLALVSDIHGNITGLKAVLSYIGKMGGVDTLYALGDLIGFGSAADEILDLLLEHRAHLIRGNWEELVCDTEAHISKMTDPELCRRAVAWAYAHLSGEYRDLLPNLPLSESIELAPGHKLVVCHAAPNDPWSLTCQPDTPTLKLREVYGAPEAEVIAYGHYHQHHVLAFDDKLLLGVGSVGLRQDGLSALSLVEFNGHWSIQQMQVPYDTAEEKRLKEERGAP